MGKNAIKVMQEGQIALDEINRGLKQTIENVLAINDAALKTGKNFFNVDSPKKLNDSLKTNKGFVKQLNAELTERNRLEKALERQLERNRQAESENAKALAKARFETQQLNKLAKESAVLSSKLSTEYQKQSVRLTQLRRRYKDVALTQGESSEAARKLLVQITALDNRLKRVDSNVGQFQRSVGNYGKAMKSAASAARNLAGALGFVGGAFFAVQVIRDAFNTVREFDRQVIAVQKTTNLTNPEIKQFKNEVIDLGIALKGVSIQGLLKSSEIAGQLGIKGRDNILKFSKVIEQLKLTSDIAGEESARSFAKFIEVSSDSVENADRLGSVITELGNNFATSESQILSNSTEVQKALAIYNASAEGVLGLGAATNALGAEAEQSRSALQKTFKVLNDGAANGKNLRRILKLTGQTAEEFRKEFGSNSVKTFERFIKGLSESADAGENLTNILRDLNLDEKRTEAVIGVLAKNYDVLSDALKRSVDEYKENNALTREADLAATSLDSIIGDLSDSWDGLILSLDTGDGFVTKAIKGFLELVTVSLNLNSVLLSLNQNSGSDFIINKQKKATKELLDTQKNSVDVLQSLLLLNNRKLAFLKTEAKFDDLSKERLKLNEKEQLQQIGIIQAIREKISVQKTEEATAKKTKNTLIEKIQALNKNLKAEDLQKKSVEELRILYASLNEALGDNNNLVLGSITYLKNVISELEKKRNSLSLTEKQYSEYTNKIDEASAALLRLEDTLKGVNNEGVNELTPKSINLFTTDSPKGLLQEEFDAYQDNEERKRLEAQKTADFEKQLREETRDNAVEAFSESINFVNALFDAKVQRYDDEINRNTDYYAKLLDNEKLTEEQRSALEAERDRKNLILEKKKREEQRKAAILNKVAGLAEVAINTAIAVSKVTAQAGIAAPLLIPSIIALGALQAATIAAQPIPQYKDGKKQGQGKDGIALLNDGGKDELRISKDGSMERIKGRNVLAPVLKSDTIIPDADKFLSNLSDKELYENLHKHTIYASMQGQSDAINSMLVSKSIDRQTEKLIKAFKSNKPKINIHNNNSVGKDISFLMRLNNTL